MSKHSWRYSECDSRACYHGHLFYTYTIISNESVVMIELEKPDENGLIGVGVRFNKIRRITGYLVGSVERFNSAKRAEVEDRVKHISMSVK